VLERGPIEGVAQEGDKHGEIKARFVQLSRKGSILYGGGWSTLAPSSDRFYHGNQPACLPLIIQFSHLPLSLSPGFIRLTESSEGYRGGGVKGTRPILLMAGGETVVPRGRILGSRKLSFVP